MPKNEKIKENGELHKLLEHFVTIDEKKIGKGKKYEINSYSFQLDNPWPIFTKDGQSFQCNSSQYRFRCKPEIKQNEEGKTKYEFTLRRHTQVMKLKNLTMDLHKYSGTWQEKWEFFKQNEKKLAEEKELCTQISLETGRSLANINKRTRPPLVSQPRPVPPSIPQTFGRRIIAENPRNLIQLDPPQCQMIVVTTNNQYQNSYLLSENARCLDFTNQNKFAILSSVPSIQLFSSDTIQNLETVPIPRNLANCFSICYWSIIQSYVIAIENKVLLHNHQVNFIGCRTTGPEEQIVNEQATGLCATENVFVCFNNIIGLLLANAFNNIIDFTSFCRVPTISSCCDICEYCNCQFILDNNGIIYYSAFSMFQAQPLSITYEEQETKLNNPRGICISVAEGKILLLVADTNNSRIIKVCLTFYDRASDGGPFRKISDEDIISPSVFTIPEYCTGTIYPTGAIQLKQNPVKLISRENRIYCICEPGNSEIDGPAAEVEVSSIIQDKPEETVNPLPAIDYPLDFSYIHSQSWEAEFQTEANAFLQKLRKTGELLLTCALTSVTRCQEFLDAQFKLREMYKWLTSPDSIPSWDDNKREKLVKTLILFAHNEHSRYLPWLNDFAMNFLSADDRSTNVKIGSIVFLSLQSKKFQFQFSIDNADRIGVKTWKPGVSVTIPFDTINEEHVSLWGSVFVRVEGTREFVFDERGMYVVIDKNPAILGVGRIIGLRDIPFLTEDTQIVGRCEIRNENILLFTSKDKLPDEIQKEWTEDVVYTVVRLPGLNPKQLQSIMIELNKIDTRFAVPDEAGFTKHSVPIEAVKSLLVALCELQEGKQEELTSSESTEIKNLPSELRMAHLRLGGEIPPILGKFLNLRELLLNHNMLTGPVPKELGLLQNLVLLYLNKNELSGSIPPELGNLANLQELRLSRNRLSGTIPPQLGLLPELNVMNLNDNELDGEIPPTFGSLPKITNLYFNNNFLSGVIPPELGNLTTLVELGLNKNKFSGSVPDNLLKLQNTFVNISDNYLFQGDTRYPTMWSTTDAFQPQRFSTFKSALK